MSDIPSDFDPALLFSDYLPNSQSEYPSQSEFPPSQSEFPPSQSEFPEHSNTDDLEAIDLVVEETRERLNRKGVVIRHRQLNPKPAFRSSSLPPGEFCMRGEWVGWLVGSDSYRNTDSSGFE